MVWTATTADDVYFGPVPLSTIMSRNSSFVLATVEISVARSREWKDDLLSTIMAEYRTNSEIGFLLVRVAPVDPENYRTSLTSEPVDSHVIGGENDV